MCAGLGFPLVMFLTVLLQLAAVLPAAAATAFASAPSSAAQQPAPSSRPASQFGCEHPPQSSMAFCDPKLDTEARIADLLGRLTPSEKLNLLNSGNNNVSRLGIGMYSWWTEMLHGVFGGFSGISGNPNHLPAKPTVFPNGVGLAASFDIHQVEAIAAVIATEARALNNAAQEAHPAESDGFQGYRAI